MTGLMLKDLLYMRRTARVIAVLLVFYLVLFAAAGSEGAVSGMLAGVIVMLTIILSTNVFAYDEAAKWKVYELSLPIPKSRIVLARYLLTLFLSTLLSLIFLLMEWFVFRGLSMESAAALLAAWSASLLFCAILFPAMYRYGMQKARLFLMVILLLPILGLMLLSKAGLPMPGESTLLLGVRLMPLLAAAVFLASYGLSCRFFARKEG